MVFHWFRRDLRLHDNTALYNALNSGEKVQCVFIFDTEILEKLEDKNDARVSFIYNELLGIKKQLNDVGADLWIFYGKPIQIWKKVLAENNASAIYTNKDYEPYAQHRDSEIQQLAAESNVEFNSYKDHVIFEENEVVKDDGSPYVVFTPYSKKWKALLQKEQLQPLPSESLFDNFNKTKSTKVLSLKDMGFIESPIKVPAKSTTQGIIKNYEKNRDFPSVNGTSRLSVHFRFGTVSIREKVAKGLQTSEKWLNELIWRDFYAQILYHFPHVVNGSFRPKYDAIAWRNNEQDFAKWCKGKTGYPLVDAGMRELNATGFMHNRVRMVVASFLTKHLLLDWRGGEAYFAKKLLDFELASNNGGWQWAAGSGVDAAPYFRIFNPHNQITKFDKDFIYIKKWVPEFGTNKYPSEMVEHKFARERCLAVYKNTLDRRE